MSALSDLINQALDRRGISGLSLRELSERSDNHLSKDAVRIYRAGTHGRPTEEVLDAWSKLLDLPIDQLRAAAGVPPGQQGPYVPPVESSRLSERQRTAVDELIRSIVAARPPEASVAAARNEDQRVRPVIEPHPSGVKPSVRGQAAIDQARAKLADDSVRRGAGRSRKGDA